MNYTRNHYNISYCLIPLNVSFYNLIQITESVYVVMAQPQVRTASKRIFNVQQNVNITFYLNLVM